MAKTLSDKLAAGMLAAGFAEGKRQGRYRTFYPDPAGAFRYLLGKHGALRKTSGAIANSSPVNLLFYDRMVAAGEAALAPKRKDDSAIEVTL